jgi:tRNA nucleotidyltransferase (CCA-adding enzyme)
MADDLLRQLKAPNSLREQVITLISHHMTKLPEDKKLLRRWLGRLGEESLGQLLLLQEADMGSKGTGQDAETDQFTQIRSLMTQIQAENACLSLKDLAVNGHDLMAIGYSGKAIGNTLNALLEQVIDQQLPNEKQALLCAAKQLYKT